MPEIVSRIIEVIVFRFAGSDPEYLLLKRSIDQTVYPGLWQMVSGKIRSGESAKTAALRELREETGFLPDRFWSVPFLSSFYDPDQDLVNINPFFAAQVPAEAEVSLSAEHQEARWARYANAGRMLIWPGQRQGLDVVHRFILSGEEAGVLTKLQ